MEPYIFVVVVAFDVDSSANNRTEHISKHKHNSINAQKNVQIRKHKRTQKRTKPQTLPHTKRTLLFLSSAGSTCRPTWFSSFPAPGAQCGQMEAEAEAMRATWKKAK